MADKAFGRKIPVALREAWEREDSDFTPWLAQKENLAILSEALGMSLEPGEQEKSIGPYKADIVCRDTETGSVVLIENQLEKSDHGHLGQLLTYAANLEAAVMVWIAESFSEEHRAALERQNKETGEHLCLFGVEVEAFRVEDSPIAVEFHIVAGPSGPSRAVVSKKRKRSVAKEDSETEARHRAYWTAFSAVLVEVGGPVGYRKPRKPRGDSEMIFATLRSGAELQAHRRPNKTIDASLYLFQESPEARFHLLKKDRDAIERDFGDQLHWRPAGATYHIETRLGDLDIDDEQDWPRQHKWLAAKLNKLHEVFADRVKALNADDWRPELDDEGAETEG